MVVELEDGLYAVNFVPYELGVHTVSVMYREVDIPGKYLKNFKWHDNIFRV